MALLTQDTTITTIENHEVDPAEELQARYSFLQEHFVNPDDGVWEDYNLFEMTTMKLTDIQFLGFWLEILLGDEQQAYTKYQEMRCPGSNWQDFNGNWLVQPNGRQLEDTKYAGQAIANAATTSGSNNNFIWIAQAETEAIAKRKLGKQEISDIWISGTERMRGEDLLACNLGSVFAQLIYRCNLGEVDAARSAYEYLKTLEVYRPETDSWNETFYLDAQGNFKGSRNPGLSEIKLWEVLLLQRIATTDTWQEKLAGIRENAGYDPEQKTFFFLEPSGRTQDIRTSVSVTHTMLNLIIDIYADRLQIKSTKKPALVLPNNMLT